MSIIVNSLQFKNWTHCSVYTRGTMLYVLCIRFPEEIFSVWKYAYYGGKYAHHSGLFFLVFTFSHIKGSPEILWDTELMKFCKTYADSPFRYTKMNSVHSNFRNIITPTVIPNFSSLISTVKKYTVTRIGVY